MKRLISLDCLRGGAIVMVVFFHAVVFNVDSTGGGGGGASQEIPLLIKLFLFLLLYFITWVGMFGMVSGFSNSISLYGHLRRGRTTRATMLKSAVSRGLIILLVNYIYLAIFTPGFLIPGQEAIGILPGLIRTGRLYHPSVGRMLFATALTMVAWGTIFTGIFLYLLTRNGGHGKPRRNYLVLIFAATVIIWCYPLVHAALRPLMTSPVTLASFPGALVASWLVGPMAPAFPYAGFTLYGAVFGMMIVDGAKRSSIFLYGYGLGFVYCVIGGVYMTTIGFWTNSFDVPDMAPLISILGPMLLLMTFLLHMLDFRGDRIKARAVRRTKVIRAFGILSLTAFILEGSFSAIIRWVFEILKPGFTYNGGFVFIVFAPVVTILWIVILKLWGRTHFAGSFEWLIVWAMGKLTGRRSQRLNVDHILRGNEAYMGDAG